MYDPFSSKYHAINRFLLQTATKQECDEFIAFRRNKSIVIWLIGLYPITSNYLFVLSKQKQFADVGYDIYLSNII